MDPLYTSRWFGSAKHTFPQTNDTTDWDDGGRPHKRLRASKSHASFLQPMTRLVRDPFEKIGAIAESLGYGLPKEEVMTDEERSTQLQLLSLRGAKTYGEWRTAAEELDRLENNDEWKQEEASDEYDVQLVRSRLERLEKAQREDDVGEMRFIVRTSLTRDLGGMGAVELYKHSRIGTKALIERYIDTVLEVLDSVANAAGHGPNAGLEAKATMEQMKFARQAFGRSALLLSGGGTLGMNHIGVVKTLFEAKLLPRIISGASAGSIVCAVLCSKTDGEIPQVLADFCNGKLDVFEEEPEGAPVGAAGGAWRMLSRLMTTGAVYDIANLKRVMQDRLGDLTFQEAYNRTQRILNICVSSADLYELPRLLNYITTPDVVIWSAVAASCSVPLVYSPAQLQVKDPKTGELKPWDDGPGKWIDGSVDNDLPMTRLAEMLNVNHFIVSQVNPHVVPFLSREEDDMDAEPPDTALKPGPTWLQSLGNLAKGETLHRMHVLAELGIFPTVMTKLRSVLGQRYAGDITIIPEITYTQFPRILRNPTPEFMVQAMFNGERATWPKLSRIRNHVAVELALDRAIHKLIMRNAFSPSQVDLRINAFARSRATRSERGRSRRDSLGQKSTRSAITARDRLYGHQGHRQVKSLVDQSNTRRSGNTLTIPTSNNDDYFSSADDDHSLRSASPTPFSDSDDDNTDQRMSDSVWDSPPPKARSTAGATHASYSVPTTPFASRSRNFTAPNTPAADLMKTSESPTGVLPVPSSPELKYKRIFHHGLRPLPTIRSQNSTPEPQEEAREKAPKPMRVLSSIGLKLDLSGTKDSQGSKGGGGEEG